MAQKTKKKKQTMSLSQFHQSVPNTGVDGDLGNGIAAAQTSTSSAQIVRIDWAAEMDKIDDNSTTPQFVFDRSKLPTAPKSVLKSDIDLELVPKTKPFRAFLGNISFEADEEKLKSFFKDLKVINVQLNTDQGGRSKGSGFIDFDDRDSLIAALNKNEAVFNNRPLRISLTDTSRGGYDRTGGYGERREQGGGYRQQSTDSNNLRSDEASWRREAPESIDTEPQQQYQSRYQSGGRYQQGGYQQSSGGGSGGYQQRRQYGNKPRSDEEGGGRPQQQQYHHQQQRRPYYQQKQYSRDTPSEPTTSTTETSGDKSPAQLVQSPPQVQSPTTSMTELKERPKLTLLPRSAKVEETAENQLGDSAKSIFGNAKPVNTAAREREIEERLKEKEKQAAVAAATNATLSQEESTEPVQDDAETRTRSHKTSFTSDDAQAPHHRPHDQEHHKQKQHFHQHGKHDNNNNSNNNRNHMSQSNSFTSPPSSSNQQQQRQHHQYNRDHHYQQQQQNFESKPAENAWKMRTASDLFNTNDNKTQNESSDMNRTNSNNVNNINSSNNNERRNYNDENNRRPPHKRPDSSQQQQQNRNHSNRDNNKDRRHVSGYSGNKGGRNNQNQRQYNNSNTNDRNNNNSRTERPYHGGSGGGYDASSHANDDSHSNQDLLKNKFANLKVDVDEAENDF